MRQDRSARFLGAVAAMIALIVSPTARAEWWEARTSHFIIYSETNRADAEKFAVELERFARLYGKPIGFFLPKDEGA